MAIETLTDAARSVLPRAEARRLDALATSLKAAARGLQAGQLSMADARSLIRSSLSIALDELTGAGLGILFGAPGAWATALAPSPLVKGLATGGAGLLGVAAAWYISDLGVAESIATALTNGLFDGARALSNAINTVVQQIYDATLGFGPSGRPPAPEQISFDLRGGVGTGGRARHGAGPSRR